MAKCDLRVEIDPEHKRVRAREAIQGTVFVEVDAECDCKDLTVTACWKTYGKGNRASGGDIKSSLFSGRWRAGQNYEYRFELEAPSSPYSYSGHYIDVVWSVEARADIPWAKDPKAAQVFELVPGGAHAVEAPKVTQSVHQPGRVISRRFRGWATVFALLFMMTVFTKLLPGLFFAAAGGYVLWLLWRNIVSERRLGSVQFVTEPEIVYPGGELTGRVTFRPRRALTINRLTMTLKATEWATKGGGKHQKTYQHDIVNLTRSVENPTVMAAGEATTVAFRFPVPETNAFTFTAPANRVAWAMKLHIDVPLWPDWKGSVSLICWPRVGDTPRELETATATATEDTSPAESAPAHTQSEPVADTKDDSGAGDSPDILETSFPLQALADELSALPSYADSKQIIERAKEQLFDVTLVVKRVSLTLGLSFDESLSNGHTVLGRVEGVSCEVTVVFPEDRNDDVQQFSLGSSQQVTCRPLDWDSFFKRIVLEAVR